jgi:bifunctional non-homologous end joining protein LigD
MLGAEGYPGEGLGLEGELLGDRDVVLEEEVEGDHVVRRERCRLRLGAEVLEREDRRRGLHLVVPLTPRANWTECLEFARALALSLVRRQPALFTERFAKTGRDDKILVDYLRNNRTNTSIAAFSTRAKPDAPVSVPLAWSELSPARTPDRFTMHTVTTRLTRLRTDPWKAYGTTKQYIPRNATAAFEAM